MSALRGIWEIADIAAKATNGDIEPATWFHAAGSTRIAQDSLVLCLMTQYPP